MQAITIPDRVIDNSIDLLLTAVDMVFGRLMLIQLLLGDIAPLHQLFDQFNYILPPLFSLFLFAQYN